jgi:hypothetical protein
MIFVLRNQHPDFGKMIGIVIRADSEEQARMLANTRAYGEGKIWGDSEKATCELVSEGGDAQIILEAIAE